jgi:hypothetical protein
VLSGFYDTLWLQNGNLRAGDACFAQRLPGKALSFSMVIMRPSISRWLNKWKDDGDDCACDQHRRNQAPVANVLVGHVQTGDGRGEQSYRHDEEENLQRQSVRLRDHRRWLGRSRRAGLRLVVWSGCLFGWRQLSDRNHSGLFLVQLAERDDPGRRLVRTAAGGFVQAESLERARKGKEDEGRSNKDAKIQVDQADVLKEGVRSRHRLSFVHKETIYDKFSPIYKRTAKNKHFRQSVRPSLWVQGGKARW